MRQKNTFRLLFSILALLLVLLPFVTTFNSAMTAFINGFGFYRWIQEFIVPFESRLVVSIINFLRVEAFVAPAGRQASFYLLKDAVYLPVELAWNCLGWQSVLLLTISLLVGLQGGFSRLSKFECVLIGILGTFLINVFRMVFITLGIYHINSVFALLIHDYFAAFLTISWLFLYWWFSYSFVLEAKKVKMVR